MSEILGWWRHAEKRILCTTHAVCVRERESEGGSGRELVLVSGVAGTALKDE